MILIISGSPRIGGGKSLQLAKYYSLLINEHNTILDCSEKEAVKYSDLLFKEATKFIFIIPEYNGSFPGIVKTIIDKAEGWSMKDKPVVLTGLSAGQFGNLRGLDHLSSILEHCGAQVVAKKIAIPKIDSVLQDTNITDIRLEGMIQEQIKCLTNSKNTNFIPL